MSGKRIYKVNYPGFRGNCFKGEKMEEKQIIIRGRSYPLFRCHTLIVGSGAAALNCAYHLVSFGVRDILVVTERLGGGVSNNSGSDKQTYYKLSLFGEGQDSVYDMARTLFNGGAMHGDIALIEATLSAQEFYHLAQIGVPFPHNAFGGYVGYKTDHDPKQRATSAGPWTSNQMYQKLLIQVRQQGTEILDGFEVISLLTVGEGEQKRAVGAIAIDKNKASSGLDSLVVFQAENVVLGTGGPGGLYQTSVYPKDHLGSTGVALEAGAAALNLTEWQYGLASIKFRWNVSGTYQQVIPRYISTAADGSDEREFLNESFPSFGKMGTAIFLKGYQWPFDPRKIENYGSSYIDLLVYQETVVKGRRVFLDFRRNPAWKGGAELRFEELESEAYDYLHKSAVLFGTPYERLQKMNPMAIQLYAQHGIDLAQEPLEIAVCAQHCNGGLLGNIWWESNVKHLFPIGEVNGTHGVYRPGGTALNSGQVGGYRAAQYIAECYRESTVTAESFLELAGPALERSVGLAEGALGRVASPNGRIWLEFREELQARMSRMAAHIRDAAQIERALAEAQAQWEAIHRFEFRLEDPARLIEYFRDRQLCLTQLAVLHSIHAYLQRQGGSRGSYLVVDPQGSASLEQLGPEWRFRPENAELRQWVLQYQFDSRTHHTAWEAVRPVPEDHFWFENVWRSYVNKEVFRDSADSR